MLLASHQGKCIRFQTTEVRVFKGRDSTGVRGIRLDGERQRHLHVDSDAMPTSTARPAIPTLRGEMAAEQMRSAWPPPSSIS